MAEAVYKSVVEIAKIIRKTLKSKYPETKFSVRSEKYAGGASINVSYTDGPKQSEVEEIINAFSGKGFDGMIDMAYYKKMWLHPDGTASIAVVQGTTGSMGYVESQENEAPVEGAVLISSGADYVFARRERTFESLTASVEALTKNPEYGYIDWNGVEVCKQEFLGKETAYIKIDDMKIPCLNDHGTIRSQL